jgi:predicted small integral membrane protein
MALVISEWIVPPPYVFVIMLPVVIAAVCVIGGAV